VLLFFAPPRNQREQFWFHRRADNGSDRSWIVRVENGRDVHGEETMVRGAFGLTTDRDSEAIKRDVVKPGRTQRAGGGADGRVSDALRSAYDQAVNEDIPKEFIDLLGKLA
jgi:hypothetical protein